MLDWDYIGECLGKMYLKKVCTYYLKERERHTHNFSLKQYGTDANWSFDSFSSIAFLSTSLFF